MNSLQGAVSKNSKDTQNALNASIAQLQQSIATCRSSRRRRGDNISTLQSQIAAGALNRTQRPAHAHGTPGSTPGATTTTTPNNGKNP